ncbi:uncharacterized protein LOC131427709 [Malaya genurostris]|uniref:uncharacterized protein LOC131427709 n=1 Tax=Malaya genurostris TaxID=325434 RepID=UPI0026F37FE0|nr:uncharacterized protein LOC131427709 [Malaya genurostris]
MDSFFGFDTTSPGSDDGDDFRRKGMNSSRNPDSDNEYDALNDETFGNPDKGDWENVHESFVRLERSKVSHSDALEDGKDTLFDEDDGLDLHLSQFDFVDDEDYSTSTIGDLSLTDDNCNKMRLKPHIWNSPSKKTLIHQVNKGISIGHEKMISVEDIERNIIQKQQLECWKTEHQQQKLVQRNQMKTEIKRHVVNSVANIPLQSVVPPAQLLAIRSPMFPPPPSLNQQSRLPIGFLPYNFLPSRYNTPISNLAMHPRISTAHQFGFYPHPCVLLPVRQPLNQNSQNNHFNNRLVQEIQQNHPMLSLNYRKHHTAQKRYNTPKGPDYDEYANLMTQREKQWLIGIQLTQLNSEMPYINDYYFTVFKERLDALKGDNDSQAYNDNRLNHPFTQHKGQSQLLLRSTLARNWGILKSKLIVNRQRKSSETKNNNDQNDQPRTYTPLQFENSLGKLQCGSVTAPRKIIDMDVVGNESTNQGNTILEVSMQRKSRHILLHIETMFKIVLKMEDLRNPAAIVAALQTKEMSETVFSSMDDNYKSSSCSSIPEPETFDELLVLLTAGLTRDKLTSIMGVRKGKILLRRIFTLLREHPCRWTFWSAMFLTIPLLTKKDRDDQEGVLFALYTEFERHVQYSQLMDLLEVSQVITGDKVLSYLTSCKFLLSSIITIIFQMETFFDKIPSSVETNQKHQWIQCLELITDTARNLLNNVTRSPNPQHTIKIDRDNIILHTIRSHFERFPQRVKGNDFLGFITADSSVV